MQKKEILQKLALITMVLDFDLPKLMQFNDLHLSYRFTGSITKLTQIYMKM